MLGNVAFKVVEVKIVDIRTLRRIVNIFDFNAFERNISVHLQMGTTGSLKVGNSRISFLGRKISISDLDGNLRNSCVVEDNRAYSDWLIEMRKGIPVGCCVATLPCVFLLVLYS